MFNQTIVGIDGRSGGADALALARQLTAHDGQLVLANVYIASQLPGRDSAGIFHAGVRRESQELLEAAAAEAGVTARLEAVNSPFVGRGLHELAEDLHADLLVVGSSGRGLLGRVLLGDDLRGALTAAPCALAVAPSGYAQRSAIVDEIGVGYDGSRESRRALAVASELARERHARLSVFEAVSLPVGRFAGARHPSKETLESELAQARERLAALGDVEVHAAYGDPVEELALYGASVDLLIVGSRGYGPLGRMLHGHTSLSLARSARCPLMVVPRAIGPDARPAVADDQPAVATTTS
jgi:nucleotide-binding universal stress UspA family protein